MPIRPILSLTTDFGVVDPFVGIMKGVIAGICPAVQMVDITHAIPPFDVLEGALAIWQARRYFPAETVHVIVVDPGVGSSRQPVLARMGGHWFIAPDNGVLTLVEREVLRQNGAAWHRRITNSRYMLSIKSDTFHGRDVFAPAAAHLAAQIERGTVAAETFGPVMESIVQLPVPEPVRRGNGLDFSIEGVILKCDRFGNLLTNLTGNDFANVGDGWAIEIGSLRITRQVRFYAEADPGEIFAILGSSGLLEIAIDRDSAQRVTGITPGTKFHLIPK